MTERIITDANGRKHITTEPLLHPTRRTWIGLTKEDKWEIVLATERDDRNTLMALVEAKLKEKNK